MITGISTACLLNHSETEDALSIIKDTGAACCGVDLRTFYEYRPEFAKKFAPRAEGMKIHSVRVSEANFEPQLTASPRRIRGDGFYWLDQVMRSAQIFGAEYYTLRGLNGGYDLDFLGDRLNEINAFCARYGLKFSLSNSVFGLYNKPTQLRELKGRCSDLNGALNVKQAEKSGYPVGMYIKDMAGSISHVYISEGISEYGLMELFKRLKDANFDGAVILEECAADNLKQTLEYINEVIYKIN